MSIKEYESKIRKMKTYGNHPTAITNIKTCNSNIAKKNGFISKVQNSNKKYAKKIKDLKSDVKKMEVKINQCNLIRTWNPYRLKEQKQTSNFMDYSSHKTHFFKWQWILMQNDKSIKA